MSSNLTPNWHSIFPGDYVASIGDIYCTDGQSPHPKYNLNLSTGFQLKHPCQKGHLPNGKIPQGLLYRKSCCYKNSTIMAKVGSKPVYSEPMGISE